MAAVKDDVDNVFTDYGYLHPETGGALVDPIDPNMIECKFQSFQYTEYNCQYI